MRNICIGYKLISYIKATVSVRFHQTLRQQAVISRHHRAGAHALLVGALPHRRQARARCQQTAAIALGKTPGELFGQRL